MGLERGRSAPCRLSPSPLLGASSPSSGRPSRALLERRMPAQRYTSPYIGLGDARDSLLGGGHEPRATRPISDGGGFGLLTVLDVVKGNDGDDDYNGILGSSDSGGCDSDAGEPSLDDRRQLGAVRPIIGHSYGLDGPIGRSCLCDEEVTPSAMETARIAKAYVDASVSRVEALAGAEDRSDDAHWTVDDSSSPHRQSEATMEARLAARSECQGLYRLRPFLSHLRLAQHLVRQTRGTYDV
eukprot:CAMPEP_0181395510 /NCGR_PEP_ID=MMETSP1106-20121128/28377_1 /TAXON_ID=81844 /ORGANISM="Mantoniella antarctica, Strain SL-175" /LENGTH=240 /DNA_ID=CAMNT_0023517133 /DNA_START=391 /DNA_END=1115 /DNA_ORIENTATION=-